MLVSQGFVQTALQAEAELETDKGRCDVEELRMENGEWRINVSPLATI